MNDSNENITPAAEAGEFLLEARNIKKHFSVRPEIGGTKKLLKAVDGVDFGVAGNSVFAVVGESGCGKSTLAKIIIKLLDPTSGTVLFKGQDISSMNGEALRRFRRSAQIIFQDPFASLNPRMRIADTLAEPFRIHRLAGRKEIRQKVTELIGKVGLNEDALPKYPHEFSGGQRQRICIARALSVAPELIVADEPLSALDVSVQAQILNLLQEIRKEMALSIIFISHDLRVVRYLSDEVAIMYLGRIVERGSTDNLFNNPKHPYTEMLLSSAPKLRYGSAESALPPAVHPIADDITGAVDTPSGCRFHPRCPKKFGPCDRIYPELKECGDSLVACHLY
jgi:oligopeptide/dipeptide ABC transporter ATP-binding protein